MRCKLGFFSSRVAAAFVVSDAGDTDWNGTYEYHTTTNGKNAYKKSGETRFLYYHPSFLSEVARPFEIINAWILGTNLGSDDSSDAYYFVESSSESPPLTGWEVENGTAAAPTLSQ